MGGAALVDVLLSLGLLVLVTGDMVLGRLVRCRMDVNTSTATDRLCVFAAYSNYLYTRSRADLTAIASATRLMLRERRFTRWPGGEHDLTGQTLGPALLRGAAEISVAKYFFMGVHSLEKQLLFRRRARGRLP